MTRSIAKRNTETLQYLQPRICQTTVQAHDHIWDKNIFTILNDFPTSFNPPNLGWGEGNLGPAPNPGRVLGGKKRLGVCFQPPTPRTMGLRTKLVSRHAITFRVSSFRDTRPFACPCHVGLTTHYTDKCTDVKLHGVRCTFLQKEKFNSYIHTSENNHSKKNKQYQNWSSIFSIHEHIISFLFCRPFFPRDITKGFRRVGECRNFYIIDTRNEEGWATSRVTMRIIARVCEFVPSYKL